MTTILNPTPVNPQLLPASYNNLAHSNILPAKKIVRTASSSDTNHAHDIEHQNYPKNYETLVTKTTLSLPPNKIAVSNIITPNICAATFDGNGAFPPSPLHSPAATAAARSNAPRTDKSWPPIRPPSKMQTAVSGKLSMPSMADVSKSCGESIAKLALRRGQQAVTLPRIDFESFVNPEHEVTVCTAVGRQEVTERTARKQRRRLERRKVFTLDGWTIPQKMVRPKRLRWRNNPPKVTDAADTSEKPRGDEARPRSSLISHPPSVPPAGPSTSMPSANVGTSTSAAGTLPRPDVAVPTRAPASVTRDEAMGVAHSDAVVPLYRGVLTPWDEIELALVLDGKAIPDHGATPVQCAAWAKNKIHEMIERREAAEALRTHVSARRGWSSAIGVLLPDWNSPLASQT